LHRNQKNLANAAYDRTETELQCGGLDDSVGLRKSGNLNGLSKKKTEIKNCQAQAPQTHEGASA
jgi:hypothetical protein